MIYYDDATIEIIQGDSIQRNIYIDGITPEMIKNVYFSCNKLNITKELEYDTANNCYLLYLSSTETSILRPINTNYDITILYGSNIVTTGVYKGRLIVHEKNNKIDI